MIAAGELAESSLLQAHQDIRALHLCPVSGGGVKGQEPCSGLNSGCSQAARESLLLLLGTPRASVSSFLTSRG